MNRIPILKESKPKENPFGLKSFLFFGLPIIASISISLKLLFWVLSQLIGK